MSYYCKKHEIQANYITCYHCYAELKKRVEELECLENKYKADINKWYDENQRLKEAIGEIILYIRKYQNFTKALEIAQKAKDHK